MLKSGAQAQANSDQVIAHAAARNRYPLSEKKKSKAGLPTVLTIVGALAVFAWWRKRRGRDANGEAGNSSAPVKGSFKQGRIGNLPRNASSNNKKNKDRRRAERNRRADRREKEASQEPAISGKGAKDGDSSIILTSTFVDPHKSSTSGMPKAQRREASSTSTGTESKKRDTLDPAFARELRRKS